MEDTTQVPGAAEREAARAWLVKTNRSQAWLAKTLELSPPVVSQWLSGAYKGDFAGVTAKVAAFLELQNKRAVVGPRPTFLETTVARQVMTVCEFAHTHRVIGMAVGAAGMGKTMSLREYERRQPQRVVYVRCNPACTSPQAVLGLVLRRFSQDVAGGAGLDRCIQDVITRLRNTDKLVIFDEAQHCSYRSLEALRAVFDEAEVGMVWAGNEGLYGLITKRGMDTYAQIHSRIAIVRQVVLGAGTDDVRLLVGEQSPEVLRYLRDRTFEPGGLRRMTEMFKRATDLACAEGNALDLGHLERAASLLVTM